MRRHYRYGDLDDCGCRLEDDSDERGPSATFEPCWKHDACDAMVKFLNEHLRRPYPHTAEDVANLLDTWGMLDADNEHYLVREEGDDESTGVSETFSPQEEVA